METTQIQKAEPSQNGLQLGNPQDVMTIANKLADFIKQRKLSVNIRGKEYCLVDGWEFAGNLMGLVPIIQSVEKITGEQGEIKYQSVVHLIRISDEKLVGKGIALCSNKESTKKMFDEYAIQSMAQTRSIGKAYRNLLGWLMKAAGYESTPAEEMPRDEQKAPATPSSSAQQGKPTPSQKEAVKTPVKQENQIQFTEEEMDLQILLNNKEKLLSRKEIKRAWEILSNREKTSYKKLSEFLTKK